MRPPSPEGPAQGCQWDSKGGPGLRLDLILDMSQHLGSTRHEPQATGALCIVEASCSPRQQLG